MNQATKRLAAPAIMAAAVLAAAPAQAHPHAWIDVAVTLLFDQDGNVSGLRQSWLFDPAYSVYATNGLTDPASLAELSRSNLKNLTEFNYFTEVENAGNQVSFGTARPVTTEVTDGRLVMVFEVPFTEPVAVDVEPLIYAIYDPTYFVEMLHTPTAPAITYDGAPSGCGHQLAAAEPDLETTLFASSLGVEESGGTGLGKLFAETVTVLCENG